MREIAGKIHDQLSLRVLLPFSRALRSVRPTRRPIIRAYYEGLNFRRRTTAWSHEQRRDWILGRLRFTLRRASRETAYYRELFDQIGFDPHDDFGFDDFARLPILDRDTVRLAGRRLVSDRVPEKRLRRDATGGSSGIPTVIWRGPEEEGWGESGIEFHMRRIGARFGTRTGMLWGHHLDPQATDSLRDRYHAFETNIRWFDCMRLSPQLLEHYHQEFMRWRPACIIAYASALSSLAEYVTERGYRPNYPTRCFVTGAEKLWPRHREMIQAAFGKPVHERYGSRDIGGMGLQLDPGRSLAYEIDWANTFIEPQSCDTDSPILVTKLHADGMMMIRYDVGDIGRFPPHSVPGQPAFQLQEVLGRTVDRIWLPDGRWITGLQIPHLMKDHPVREFMFVQRADYSVDIQVIPKNDFTEHSRQRILEMVAANLPGLRLNLLLVESIPRTKASKWRPVVSEIKAGAGA